MTESLDPFNNEPEQVNEGPERKPCPKCGKEVTWTRKGQPRVHKCEPVEPEQEQHEEQPQPAGAVTADRVLKAYIATRDEIAAIKKEAEVKTRALTDLQEKRAAWLKGTMDRLGTDNIGAKGIGKAFIEWKDYARVSDWETFHAWVLVNEEYDFLEHRVSKGAVKQMLEDSKELPPGIDYTKIKDIKVRRA